MIKDIIKLTKTLLLELPKTIESKHYDQESETFYYDSDLSGPSYYWLVRFSNGKRIPFPILNRGGVDSSPYKYGSLNKTKKEKIKILIQESIVWTIEKIRPNLFVSFIDIDQT